MTDNLEQITERQLISLIAVDRIDIPVSSMSGKLKRQKPKIASSINIESYVGKKFEGERTYARLEEENKEKARGMKEGIEEFTKQHPTYGAKLQDLIDEKREVRERHLYFGMNEGRRLTTSDYMGVMESLGFSPAIAESMYNALMDASRKMSKNRDEERSVMVDSTLGD